MPKNKRKNIADKPIIAVKKNKTKLSDGTKWTRRKKGKTDFVLFKR